MRVPEPGGGAAAFSCDWSKFIRGYNRGDGSGIEARVRWYDWNGDWKILAGGDFWSRRDFGGLMREMA
jgi:GH24 family phage-related lysozyme (muramidase)